MEYYNGSTTTAFALGSNITAASTLGNVIELTYNGDLDASTVSTSTVKLYNVTDGKFVALEYAGYSGGTVIAVLSTSDELDSSKKYELRVDGVKDLAGNAAQSIVVDFTRGTAATVAVDPTTLGTNVYPYLASNPVVGKFGFNLTFLPKVGAAVVELDETTVNNTTIYLEEAETEAVVPASVVYNKANGSITLVPAADLKEDTVYNIVVDGVKDTVGIKATGSNQSFTTGDYSAPTIVSSTLTDGGTLPANGKIELQFNEEIDHDSLVGGASKVFTATTGTGSSTVPGVTVVLVNLTTDTAIDVSSYITPVDKDDKTKVTIDLSGAGLVKGNSYKLALSGKNTKGYNTLKDTSSNGNQLASDYVLNFYLEADTTAPTVKSVVGAHNDGTQYILANGATNVNPAKIVIGLNDKDIAAVTPTTLSSSTLVKVYDVAAKAYVTTGTFEIKDNGTKEDSIEITGAFTAGKTYKVEVTSDLQDTSGNKAKAVNWTFTFGQGSVVTWDTTAVADREEVAVDDIIKLTAANLNAATVNTTNVKLVKVSDGSEVAVDVSYASGKIEIEPKAALSNSTAYKVVLENVKDANGNAAVANATAKPSKLEFAFETEAGVASEATISVANGSINVDRNVVITVTFDDVAPADTVISGPGTVKWATNRKSATITTNNLTSYTDYTVNVSSVDGEFSTYSTFTTGSTATDAVAPKLLTFEGLAITSSPAIFAAGSDVLDFVFDENIASVGGASIVKLGQPATAAQPAIVSKAIQTDKTQYKVTLDTELTAGYYEVKLTDVKDASGNATQVSLTVKVDNTQAAVIEYKQAVTPTYNASTGIFTVTNTPLSTVADSELTNYYADAKITYTVGGVTTSTYLSALAGNGRGKLVDQPATVTFDIATLASTFPAGTYSIVVTPVLTTVAPGTALTDAGVVYTGTALAPITYTK